MSQLQHSIEAIGSDLEKKKLFDLFPEIEPYETGFLEVDEPHELYWEQCGNPEGIPVVFLHGGPGGRCSGKSRRYFDPDHYRIICFDQRGAGQSKPDFCLENNSPAHLVSDIEALREHLEIEKWHVFGGSWGSTLSLLYAIEHPERITSMVLRGIFLMEQADIDWLYSKNRHIFPEAWEEFLEYIPEEEQDDLLAAYGKRLFDEDPKIHRKAAIVWSLYESSCASLIPNYETITTKEQVDHALAIAKIECHFFTNYLISEEESILKKVDRFRHIPTIMIHGRYDMICPLLTAHKLHKEWPEADFIIVPDAGHSSSDPGIRSRLIEATETMKAIK